LSYEYKKGGEIIMTIGSIGSEKVVTEYQEKNKEIYNNLSEVTSPVELNNYISKHPEYRLTQRQEMILENVKNVEEELNGLNLSLQYDIHEETHRLMIKVVNNENNQVVKEIPPEKLLDLAAEMYDRLGIFVDEEC